jgi:hypothetical protein
MMKHIDLPRTNAQPLTGWLLSDACGPRHEIRYCRACLDLKPTRRERAEILRMAKEMEPVPGRKITFESWAWRRTA